MRKNKKRNPEKLLSVVVAAALVCALAVGVISVVRNTKDGSANIVDLNETKVDEAKNDSGENDTKKNTVPIENNTYTREQTTQEPLTMAEIKQEQQESASAQDTDIPVKKPAAKAAADSNENILARYSFGENDTLKWPVQGDVIMKFNMDSTVYFKTLGLYKVNPAINISAPVGTDVIAAASGIVSSVTDSEETGTTVTVSIGNDYVTTYGLIDNVTLKKGMTVVAGDVIGKVAEPTKYYAQEGPNLYFKLTNADTPVDPAMYLE